jgi:hypothetical protein
MYYSAKTGGLYDYPENYPGSWPSDAIEISDEVYAMVKTPRPPGKVLVIGIDGLPMLADAPPPSEEEVREQALSDLAGLMASATVKMAPLQDGVDIDEATPAEIELLKKWKKYRLDLSRVDKQTGFPAVINWPGEPA